MKKILIAGNIILAAIVIHQACKPIDDSPNAEKCKNVICRDYTSAAWNGTIDAFTAKMISDNYKADTGKKYVWFGSRADTMKDATSIWFSLDSLKKFFWEIESASCMNNCKDTLGIRFYYARYPDRETMRGLGLGAVDHFANRHTLFAVPTYWDVARRKNIDFNPFAGCRGRFNFNPTDSSRTLIFWGMGTGGSGNLQNHGGLVPPPDDEGTFTGF